MKGNIEKKKHGRKVINRYKRRRWWHYRWRKIIFGERTQGNFFVHEWTFILNGLLFLCYSCYCLYSNWWMLPFNRKNSFYMNDTISKLANNELTLKKYKIQQQLFVLYNINSFQFFIWNFFALKLNVDIHSKLCRRTKIVTHIWRYKLVFRLIEVFGWFNKLG